MSSTTEIIKVIDGKITHGDELHIFLADLSAKAKLVPVERDGLKVTFKDRSTCEQAQELTKWAAREIAFVMAAAEPERMRLQRAKDDLIADRDKLVAAIQTQIADLDRAVRTFYLDEKAATQKEQDRLNRNRKPENQIELKPNLPALPGAPRVVGHYRFKVLDPKKVGREFWCIDEKAIAKKLRDDKNVKKSEKEIGGIKAWVE